MDNNINKQERSVFPEAQFEAIGFSDNPEELQKEIAEMIAKSKKLYEEKYGSSSTSETEELETLDIDFEQQKVL